MLLKGFPLLRNFDLQKQSLKNEIQVTISSKHL